MPVGRVVKLTSASAGYPLSGGNVLAGLLPGTVVETHLDQGDPSYVAATVLWLPRNESAGEKHAVGATGFVMKVDVVEATELTALHSFNASGDDEASFAEGETVYGFKVGCVQRYLSRCVYNTRTM